MATPWVLVDETVPGPAWLASTHLPPPMVDTRLRMPTHTSRPPRPHAVATALSEGEARRKHVVMVEIMGQQASAAVCRWAAALAGWCEGGWRGAGRAPDVEAGVGPAAWLAPHVAHAQHNPALDFWGPAGSATGCALCLPT